MMIWGRLSLLSPLSLPPSLSSLSPSLSRFEVRRSTTPDYARVCVCVFAFIHLKALCRSDERVRVDIARTVQTQTYHVYLACVLITKSAAARVVYYKITRWFKSYSSLHVWAFWDALLAFAAFRSGGWRRKLTRVQSKYPPTPKEASSCCCLFYFHWVENTLKPRVCIMQATYTTHTLSLFPVRISPLYSI